MFVKCWLYFILGLSLVVKIGLVLTSGEMYNLQSDDREYLKTAQIWLETGMFTYNDPNRPTVFITPGFPAFIAILMKFIGNGFVLEQTIRILQAVMVIAGLYFLFLIGKRMFSEKAALLAVILSTFYPPLWLVSNLILTESMFVFVLMLLVYVAIRAMETPSYKWGVLFGLVWVLTVYIRPTIALWPGLFFLLLLYWRQIPWAKLVKIGVVTAFVLILCLSPWWVRNYHVSGGQFIPLTKSGGNPLLLGTFPYHLPSIEEQRTWHKTENLWENDEFDSKWAKQRIKEGFQNSFWFYLKWYTIGKFSKFWGEPFYWLPILSIPKALVWSYHLLLVVLGFIGMWFSVKNRGAVAVMVLCGYFTLLHMIYLAHERYSVPLMPFLALFTADLVIAKIASKKLRGTNC
ncbi:ArnT family glycosyltransferase [Effusibacillus consociatus]